VNYIIHLIFFLILDIKKIFIDMQNFYLLIHVKLLLIVGKLIISYPKDKVFFFHKYQIKIF